jgi:hypothetical protein
MASRKTRTRSGSRGFDGKRGWGLHPLESAALSRRTRQADIADHDITSLVGLSCVERRSERASSWARGLFVGRTYHFRCDPLGRSGDMIRRGTMANPFNKRGTPRLQEVSHKSRFKSPRRHCLPIKLVILVKGPHRYFPRRDYRAMRLFRRVALSKGELKDCPVTFQSYR